MKFLPDQNYDCVQCGRACREGWDLLVDPATRGRLRGSELELRVMQEKGISETLVAKGNQVVMACQEGQCVYLDERTLCRIHSEMGPSAKPLGCRQFPFFLVETPEDTYVGLSYYCTAAQQNVGRPLSVHQADLEALLRKKPARKVGFAPLVLDGSSELTWDEYLVLERYVWDGLAEGLPERVLASAVWGACCKVSEGGPLVLDPGVSAVFDRSSELFDIRLMCLSILVASQEADTPEEAWPLTEAIRADEVVTLTRWGWSGRRTEIDALAGTLPSWLQDEIARYLRSLVFRKFLALDRTVLQNLLALYMLPPILRTYSIISSLSRGEPLSREDYYRALSFTEKDLSHTLQGKEGTWSSFARLYLETVRLLRPYV